MQLKTPKNFSKLGKFRNKVLKTLSVATLSLAIGATTLLNDGIATTPSATVQANKTDALSSATFAYLDVGQGNSELIKVGKKAILIDTGKGSEYDELQYQLEKLKVSKINTLVISHPDADHMENADEIISDYGVKKVIMPEIGATTQCYKRLLSAIKTKKVKTVHPEIGDTIKFAKGCKAKVLSVDASSSDKNEASLVMRVTYGSRSFLYMGDATAKVESDIIDSGEEIASDVYLMAHHGSDTANGILFQKKVLSAAYKIAVISVGDDNSYGHPVKQVVDRANRFAKSLYRTDKKGAIVFKTDGKKLKKSFIKVTHSSKKSSGSGSGSGASSGSSSSGRTNGRGNSNSGTSTSNSTTSTWVYVTDTGSKYHKDGCRYLSQSKIRKKLSDAKAEGYEPCSVCY